MSRLSSAAFLALVASVSGWTTLSVRHAGTSVVSQHRRSAALLMNSPVEEKKGGLFGMFGNKEAEGKVVPTGKNAEGEEELSESKKMLQQVKDAGIAGIISYVFWEWAFWGVSIPVCISGYYGVTGHWPDLSNPDDQAKLAGEAFAFVNVARFAIPLRIGLALSTTPWVQSNVVDRFGIGKDKKED